MKRILHLFFVSIVVLFTSGVVFAAQGYTYVYGPAQPLTTSASYADFASCNSAKEQYQNSHPGVYVGACLLVTIQGSPVEAPVSVSGTPVSGGSGSSGTPVSGGSSGGSQVSVRLDNPIAANTFDELVEKVIEAAVAVLTPLVVVMFIWSGFLFVKAQGKPEEIENAKTAITYSFLGAVILLGAYGFAQIIGQTVTTITGQ